MKKLLFIIPILIASFTSAQDVFQSELFPADIVLKHRADLDLSNAQIAYIKKVHTESMTTYNALKWDLDSELMIMIDMLSSGKIDSSASMQQMTNILTLERELKLTKLSLLISIKNQLNSTQLQQLKKIKSVSSDESFNFITPINKNPRVVLKVDGPDIDGQPIYYIGDKNGKRRVESLKTVDKNNIESITVLKGEGATKLYGQEGKNGVVIIYLKKSK